MKPESHARIVVASAVVVVSFAAILIRLCTVPTAVIAGLRLSMAALILLPVFASKGERRAVTRRVVGLSVMAGFFLAVHFLSWIESLRWTTVASSVVLVTTSPIFSAVFAWLFLRERIGRKTLIAIVLCIGGSVTISRGGFDLSPEVLKGNMLAIVGAAAFGAYFVTGRTVRRVVGFLEYAFMAYAAAAVVLVGWMLVRGQGFTGFDPINYFWILLLALGPQVFGHTTFNWALRYMPAPKVAISVLGEPIGSALLAWLFFAEVPGGTLFIGAALILYGVYLTMTERPRPQQPGL
jgi:drug/metabolite transporter (DMT)-like permease